MAIPVPKPNFKKTKSARTKACDIPMKVKQAVWERDGGRCVVCGSAYNVMPNAHFVPRSQGGLGVERNIVTMCTNLTEHKCHYRMDMMGDTEIKDRVREYLQSQYADWNEEELTYDKAGSMGV